MGDLLRRLRPSIVGLETFHPTEQTCCSQLQEFSLDDSLSGKLKLINGQFERHLASCFLELALFNVRLQYLSIMLNC